MCPKIRANFELYEDSLTPLTFAMNRANVKVAKTIENCAQKKFSDHALSFLGFTILGLPCFFLFSVVIVIIGMIAHLAYIYPEDCEEVRHYPSKEYLETKCEAEFIIKMLLRVWQGFYCSPYGPFAWPWLLYSRYVLLYFRDMHLTNHIHRTFDH